MAGDGVVFTPEVQRRLDEIARLWNAIEGDLKRAERIRLEVIISAVNELRYAGRQAVDAIAIAGNPNLPEAQKHLLLDEAIAKISHNCARAHSDVTDALVLYYHKNLDANVEDFSLSIVLTHFPQYGEMLNEIRQINTFMAKSRQERFERQDIYKVINENHLPKLETLFDNMHAAAPDLIAEINDRNRARARDSKIGKWGVAIGIVGAALAVFALYIGIAPAYHLPPFGMEAAATVPIAPTSPKP